MGGYALDQWVATPKGLVQAGDLALPTTLREVVEVHLRDGSRIRCAADQEVLTKSRGWVMAADLSEVDRVLRSVEYVARSECPTGLPEHARALAVRASLDLPTTWNENLAHYLGWLVGDGNFSACGAVTIYGSGAEHRHTMPQHQRLLAEYAGFRPKPSAQANGTYQLRLQRRDFVQYLSALGVAQVKSARKIVPAAVLTAPEEALNAFLRGLFDADGCVVNDVRKGTRYVGLGSTSEELLLGVQALLASLGMSSRIYRMGCKKNSFSYTRRDGTTVTYSSGPSFDLRITGRSLREFAAHVDFDLPQKQSKLLALIDDHGYYEVDESVLVKEVVRRPGVQSVVSVGEGSTA